MGGYGSGGLNRTHDTVEDYRRVDSFAFYNFLNSDKYLHYKDAVRYPNAGNDLIYHVKTKTASIEYNGYECPLGLSRTPNIDGKTMRMYFLCPECERRVRYLYRKNGSYLCRKCAKLNYESQQQSGQRELVHKMEYIVEKKLKYTQWYYEHPHTHLADLEYIPKPKYMRWEKYNRLMEELRYLQGEFLMTELVNFGKFYNMADWR